MNYNYQKIIFNCWG